MHPDDFKQYKKGDLLYISLDDAPEEEMQFVFVEFQKLYYHRTAKGWYIDVWMIDSFDKWKVKVSNTQVLYSPHKITKVKKATAAEYIIYHLEEEGDGNVLAGATG